MKKRIIRVIAVAVVVAAVVFAVLWQRSHQGGNTGGELKLYGTMDIRDADLAFTEEERIAAVLVEEGDRVKAGQVLARLNTERIEAQIREAKARIAAQQEVVQKLRAGSRPQEIEEARAQVTAATAELQNAEVNRQRIKKTSGTGATSDQLLDNANSRLAVAQANLDESKSALALALEGPRKEDIAAAENTLEALKGSLAFLNVRLSDTTLAAPADGIVQNRILEPGEMAGPAKPVLTLALTDPKWARVYVSEPDLGRISSGMKAKIHSDSYPGKTVDGWIGFISPTAEFTPKAVETEELRTKLVYEVRVFAKDPDNMLRLGMPVTVTLEE